METVFNENKMRYFARYECRTKGFERLSSATDGGGVRFAKPLLYFRIVGFGGLLSDLWKGFRIIIGNVIFVEYNIRRV